MKFHAPYHMGKMCYRLALRPPVDLIKQSVYSFKKESIHEQDKKARRALTIMYCSKCA